jgi:hypothetical protein
MTRQAIQVQRWLTRAQRQAAAAVDTARHAFELARRRMTPRQRAAAAFVPPPEARFAGDPHRWIQEGDTREYPGDVELGWGRLERWRAAGTRWTSATSSPSTASITGYVIDAGNAPQPFPHAIVEARDLIVDFSRLYPARTLRHRPRYRMGRGCPYHRYRAGALSALCRWDDPSRISVLSQDHLRDIFDSFTPAAARVAVDDTIDHPVLFVTREGDESANLFHATTEFLNAFQSVVVSDGIDRLDLGVVLLDNAPGAPFDALWTRVFAPGRGVRRVRDFGGRRVRFRRAIFSTPGYQSCCYAYLASDEAPAGRVGLIEAFSALVLRGHGIDPGAGDRASAQRRATLAIRRPPAAGGALKRRLADEDACLRALDGVGLSVRAVDFGTLSIEEQIRLAHETDVLIGVHGAALTHLLWTPPHAHVIEIDRPDRGWNSYRNLARWSGRAFTRVAGEERPAPAGTEIAVDPARLAQAAAESPVIA